MRILNLLAACSIGLALVGSGWAQTLKTVDCDKGKTISEAVSKLDWDKDTVVQVSGTCNENVIIGDFEGPSLQIVGSPTAIINGQAVSPLVGTIDVSSSRKVRISNLTINPPLTPSPSSPSTSAGGIRMTLCRGCTIDNVTVNADRLGILIAQSQVILNIVSVNISSTGTATAITASSDVSLANYAATGTAGSPPSNSGLVLDGDSHARLNYSAPAEIKNFNDGILVRYNSSLEGPGPCGFPGPPTACLSIHDNVRGIHAVASHIQAMSGVTLNNNGDGVWIEQGSLAILGPLFNVTNSTGTGLAAGVGIFATHGSSIQLTSFAPTLPANTITGNIFRGIALANGSTLELDGLAGAEQNNVTGTTSGTDISCDATSSVTGTNTVPVAPGPATVFACANTNPAPIPIP